MINVLFHGNCQVGAVKCTLNLPSNLYNCFTVLVYITTLTKNDFLTILETCDIIITQPIKDNYKDVDYLSTSYLINNCKKNAKIIIFDTCHFDFYYFDLIYKKLNHPIHNNLLPYHYSNMIECYNKNYPIEYYINNFVNNENLKTQEELEIIAENSLNILKDRNNHTINLYSNMKKECLDNFDWKTYVSYYPDLSFITNKEDAWHHWIMFGKSESRIFFKGECLDNFDWKTYVSHYPDLSFITNKEDAWHHWIMFGKSESRIFFDYINKPHIISTYDFIKQNYKNKLLFYTFNHPTKYLIHYICEELIKCLKIPNSINYDIDTMQYLRCIIYKCIQKNVNFDISQNTPLLNPGKQNVYDITQKYYHIYEADKYPI